MSNTKEGGPAFPYSALCPEGPVVYKDNEGMSLLDWFAGKALEGIMANPDVLRIINKLGGTHADFCYNAAEMMLDEREKRKTKKYEST